MKLGVLLVLCCVLYTQAYYLPGVAPVEYDDGEQVPLKVIKLTSIHTQLPYRYYDLPFCAPSKIVDEKENLGEVLRGDRIENSLYEVSKGAVFVLLENGVVGCDIWKLHKHCNAHFWTLPPAKKQDITAHVEAYYF
jgi:hypothetical protein